MSIVEKANKIINGRSEEKERQYGPMFDGMKNASRILCHLTGDKFSENSFKDVLTSYKALYALKLSREKYNHKEDNILDSIAYRIAELNAIRILNGISEFSIEGFREAYDSHQFNNKFQKRKEIYESTLGDDLSDKSIYLILIGEEFEKESKLSPAIQYKEIQSCIFNQIKYLDLLNSLLNEN